MTSTISEASPSDNELGARGKVVRVAMVDDHEVVSIAIGALVASLVDFEFVGAFKDVDALFAAEVGADLIVLDLNLGNGTSPTMNVARLRARACSA